MIVISFYFDEKLSFSSFLLELIRFLFEDTSKVWRGCTLDDGGSDTQWCTEENGCEKCSKSACNVKNGRFTWCVRCEDSKDSGCATLPNINEYIDQCEHKPYPYEKRGCFTKIHAGIPNFFLLFFHSNVFICCIQFQ